MLKTSASILLALLLFVLLLPAPLMAQDDDTDSRTVRIRIDRLEALNLSDDGLFDDGEDEIALYYFITEVDRFGNELTRSTVYRKFERRFDANEVHDDIPELMLDIAPSSTAIITLVLVEVDEGDFELDRYLESLNFGDFAEGDAIVDMECGASTLFAILTALSTANPVPLLGAGPACFDDAVGNLTLGGDDLFESPIFITLPARLPAHYIETTDYTFRWSNQTTNSAQYRMEYTIEVTGGDDATGLLG